ncbi:MAG: hypothetical protein AB8B74_13420 [Crocinitomicaceae bacterium]
MKLIISIFCAIFTCTSFSQKLSDFKYLNETYGNNELYIGVNPTFSFMNNKAAPFPERHSLKGFSAELSMRKVNFDKGTLSWNWQHKMLGDVLLLVNNALTKTNASVLLREEETSLTCGIIGWIDMTIAINHPNNKWQWSLGANHHDYFYGSTYSVDTIPNESWASLNPQGYFFAAGPTLKVNYLLNRFLMTEVSSSYSFSYWKAIDLTYAHQPDVEYPLPHFGQIDFELQTKWGLFGGINYNWIVNRGHIPSEGKRLDLIFGFRFMT